MMANRKRNEREKFLTRGPAERKQSGKTGEIPEKGEMTLCWRGGEKGRTILRWDENGEKKNFGLFSEKKKKDDSIRRPCECVRREERSLSQPPF